jgi:hypothetical protein
MNANTYAQITGGKTNYEYPGIGTNEQAANGSCREDHCGERPND